MVYVNLACYQVIIRYVETKVEIMAYTALHKGIFFLEVTVLTVYRKQGGRTK